ncbi:MAG: AAA family ATPase [Nitrososphaerota archaeon]
MPDLGKILEALGDGEVREILRKALQIQERELSRGKSYEDWLGFEWYEVGAAPQTLNKLVRLGLLEIGYKSNKATHYKIPDPARVVQLLEEAERGEVQVEAVREIPPDLFSIIVGHGDVKEILWRSIRSNGTVHVLLHGSPASAKSLFLEELSRLPNSRFVLGSSLTKAGLIQVLFDNRPRYLIIDEIDKISDEDNLSALLSLMERGIVVETKYNRQRSIRLTTTVFAAANRIEVLPPELLSRFVRLRFRDYMPDEFMEVVRVVLTEREKVPPPLAIYIGEKVLRELASRDPRDAVKVARLMSEQTKEEVDRVIEILVRRR